MTTLYASEKRPDSPRPPSDEQPENIWLNPPARTVTPPGGRTRLTVFSELQPLNMQEKALFCTVSLTFMAGPVLRRVQFSNVDSYVRLVTSLASKRDRPAADTMASDPLNSPEAAELPGVATREYRFPAISARPLPDVPWRTLTTAPLALDTGYWDFM